MTGFPPLVFLSDPDEIREMLTASTNALRAGEGAMTTMPIVGSDSFMLKDGEEHTVERAKIVRSLRSKAVQKHTEMVAEVTHRAITTWPREAPFALHPGLRALTLEVVLRRTFGSRAHAFEDELRTLHKLILQMLEVTASPVFPEPVLRHGPGYVTWQRFLRNRAEVDDLLYALIDRYRGAAEAGADDLFASLAAREQDSPPLSAQQLRDNLVSLLLAGHETTAAQLAWAFQLLAHNPAILNRLASEVLRGEEDSYLTAVIHEVLRHRPVFLFAVPRAIADPVEIGDWTYHPPGQLLGCIYLVHHDRSLYPNPEAFQPERFLAAPPQPHTWIPWGGGRKRCPGLHLATLEIKTVLRSVLSNATVLAATKQIERPRWRSVIVAPHAGSRVVLRPKQHTSTRIPRRASV